MVRHLTMTAACTFVLGLALLALPVDNCRVQEQASAVCMPQAVRTTLEMARYLQDASVTIKVETGDPHETSLGTGFLRTTRDGQVWVWTCAHVVAPARKQSDCGEGDCSAFEHVQIIKTFQKDNGKVGELTLEAEVIRYSDDEHDDLALLRVITPDFIPKVTARFFLEKHAPPVGSEVMFCGTFLGRIGNMAISNGIISLHNRSLNDMLFDQTSVPAFPGGSGGMMALRDGRCVGILVRQGSPGGTFSLFVPVRRMRAWAQQTGVEFTMDDLLQVPSDEELHSHPVEESLDPASIR